MFSTKIDQMAMDASAGKAPGDLKMVVCKPRAAPRRRKARVKAKAAKPLAQQPIRKRPRRRAPAQLGGSLAVAAAHPAGALSTRVQKVLNWVFGL